MRDIREDLKERIASIRVEVDELMKRQDFLSSLQQSLFGLLEEEDRRYRDQVSLQIAPSEPTPITSSESASNGLNAAEPPNPARVFHRSWTELRAAER